MSQLDGKVALITGGARGQGRAHALALAAQGADIAVVDIAANVPVIGYPMASEDQLAETVKLVEELGVHAIGIKADARSTDEINGAVQRAVGELGSVDILIANHGVVDFAPIEHTSDESWSTIVDINLTGIFKVVRAVIPYMKERGWGRIVATSSMGARQTAPNLAHYISAKWGVIGLVKSAALELADTGITVNAITPGAVATDLFFNQPTYDLFCADLPKPVTEQQFRDRLDELNYGLNGVRYLEVDDVARTMLYLVLDRGLISGQVAEIGLLGPARSIY